ncbi:hypothetical protein HK405_012838, partial [Cladochytrium tenue]
MAAVVAPDMSEAAAAAARLALSSAGLVFWSFQLVPQVLKNARRRSAEGLSLALVLTWAAWAIPFGAGVARNHLAVPFLIQPNLFAFFANVCAVQLLYYRSQSPPAEGTPADDDATTDDADPEAGADDKPAAVLADGDSADHEWAVAKVGDNEEQQESHPQQPVAAPAAIAAAGNDDEARSRRQRRRPMTVAEAVIILVGLCLIIGGGEVGLYYLMLWLDSSSSESVRRISPVIASAAALLIVGGLVPQFVEIWRTRSCKGIAPVFLWMDIAGGFFSTVGLLFQPPPFDAVTAASYVSVIVLDGTILALG